MTVPGGGGTGGTPSPSPTPAPPAYAAFDELTGSQSFDADCAVGGDGGLDSFFAFPRGVIQATVSYDAESEEWGIEGLPISVDLSFGPEDRLEDNTGDAIEYAGEDELGDSTSFRIFGGSYGQFEMDYVRTVTIRAGPEDRRMVAFCVMGVPTLGTDFPEVTAFSYDRVRFIGMVSVLDVATVTNYSIYGSTVTLDVDRDKADDALFATLSLIGAPPIGDPIDLGDYRLGAALDLPDITFNGLMYYDTPEGPRVSPDFRGRFYGPQAGEVAFAVRSEARDTSVGESVQIVGLLVGVR